MVKYTPFFPLTNDRNEAFPKGEAFEIIVKQDEYGEYNTPEWRRSSTYNRSNVPRFETCANPRCQQGGIDLQKQLMHYPADGNQYTATYRCNGHEGTPKGRRIGDSCENSFTVLITKRKVGEV